MQFTASSIVSWTILFFQQKLLPIHEDIYNTVF